MELVIVDFIVKPDETITNIEIGKSVHKLLNEETIRITKLMFKWMLGKQKEKPMRARYKMHLRFL